MGAANRKYGKRIMKLWLLESLGDSACNPWVPWYDKCFGFIISAKTEKDARELADFKGGCENTGKEGVRPWLDPNLSTCKELKAKDYDKEEVVMWDFHGTG